MKGTKIMNEAMKDSMTKVFEDAMNETMKDSVNKSFEDAVNVVAKKKSKDTSITETNNLPADKQLLSGIIS